MKYAKIQLYALIAIGFAWVGCGEDKAREAATEAAQAATESAAATPAEAPQAAPTTDRAPSGTINMAIGTQSAGAGQTVCVPVTARDFNKIVSMQYSVKWDANVLKFKELKTFGLPGLSAQNFGTHQAEKQGILTHSWYDANVQGITLANGSTLYEVCFEAVGKPSEKSAVAFVNAPVIFEIADVNSKFLELVGTPGSVSVK